MIRRTTFTFRLLFLIYVAAVLSLCFFNLSIPENSKIPYLILGIPIDKIVHFVMFTPFPILIPVAFPRASVLLSFILGVLFAASTELVQYFFLPLRDGDILDFAADVVGMTVGLICAQKFIRQRSA